VWLFDKGNQDYFKRWGANYHYLPWGANSSFKVTRDYNESLIQRVVFIGNPYGSRVKMINELLKSGIPVDMYIAGGSNQPALKVSKIKYLFKYVYENRYRLYYFIRLIQTNYGRKIFFSRLYSLVSRNLDFSNKNLRVYDRLDYENISLVIQSYRLVLNSAYLNSTGYLINPIEIINLRTFEIPALGGLQLVQESIEISRFFEDGYDIVFYNRRNLKEVIKKYLHDVSDSTIIEMRSKAFEKVKKMHNWSARFSEISKLLRF
jgi:spore maturation protein CgeB